MTPTILEFVPNLGAKLESVQVTIVTTADWVIFPKAVGFALFTLPTGAVTTQAYAVAAVNEDVAGIVVADTDFEYDGSTAGQFPDSGDEFYIQIDKEIMRVNSYGATTMNVSRGQFGTTAAIHATNAVIYILNTLVIAAGTVGLVRGMVSYLE